MGKTLVRDIAMITVFFCLVSSVWAAGGMEEAQRHFNRGMAAVEIAKAPEDYDLAIGEFQQARALAPNWPDVYYNLGLIQDKSGKYRDAADSLRSYLQLVPDSADAAEIRVIIDKAEFKAEQVLSSDDILNIVVSLNDKSKWELKGITNAQLLQRSGFGWWRSFKRGFSPENKNRLFYSFRSNSCAPGADGNSFDSALPSGNVIEFQTYVCAGPDGSLLSQFDYRLEVVSRNKVKMSVKVERSQEYADRTEAASYEFVRR